MSPHGWSDVIRSHDSTPAVPSAPAVPGVVSHLAMALSGHIRRLSQQGYAVPREVREFAAVLSQLASTRLDTPTPAIDTGRPDHGPVPHRLLVTKAEAAEQLGVSMRTVERLAATGRLPQVHVDRAVRFRVRDLENFVDSLTDHVPCPGDATGGRDDRASAGHHDHDHDRGPDDGPHSGSTGDADGDPVASTG